MWVVLDKGLDHLVNAGIGGEAERFGAGSRNACGQPEIICWICGSGSQWMRA